MVGLIGATIWLVDFSDYVQQVDESGSSVVDSSAWAGHWTDEWVAFADLVGFADRSVHDATVVNQIVKFHRALSSCRTAFPEVHLLPFTDSAYAAASDVCVLVKWASALQHACLAANTIMLKSGRRLFHAMLVPRVTIGHGRLLRATEFLGARPETAGVLTDGLFVGEGVVDAYRIEKGGAGSLISISERCVSSAQALDIRGLRKGPYRAMIDWKNSSLAPAHDGVMDFPWLLLDAVQPKGDELWVDSHASVRHKLRLLNEIWELSFGEYIVRNLPVATTKHFGAVKRHLAQIVQAINGSDSRRSSWTTARLQQRLWDDSRLPKSERSREGLDGLTQPT
jgi:hypothetical protein